MRTFALIILYLIAGISIIALAGFADMMLNIWPTGLLFVLLGLFGSGLLINKLNKN